MSRLQFSNLTENSNLLPFCVFVKVKLATLVEGDPKAAFSIVMTPRCRGERYPILWIAPLYPWSVSYNAGCKAVTSTFIWVFGKTRPGIKPWPPGPLVNTLLIRLMIFMINSFQSGPHIFAEVTPATVTKKHVQHSSRCWHGSPVQSIFYIILVELGFMIGIL